MICMYWRRIPLFHVCPLCNGLISLEFQCPNCLNPAVDCGKRDDYVGPYAPYEESGDNLQSAVDKALLSDCLHTGSSPKQCLHMLYCDACSTTVWIDGFQIRSDA